MCIRDRPYTADDFYPGDEYVDWVGVNCYASKYFQGRVWQGESRYNEVCFKTGYLSLIHIYISGVQKLKIVFESYDTNVFKQFDKLPGELANVIVSKTK